MIHSLVGLNESQRSLVGDKALRLSWLRQHGFQIPEGFVLDAASYREIIELNNYSDILLNLKNMQVPRRSDELERLSSIMCQGIFALDFPDDFIAEIGKFWEEMGSPAVVVRPADIGNTMSGGNLSGRPRGSSNIRDLESILLAVKLAWVNLWTEDAIHYRQRMGLSQQKLSIAVIVQRFIPGISSGLLYTANPRNNREDQLVIRSTWGLGEALVRDEVRPDHWVLDASGAIYQANITVKNEMRQAVTAPTQSGTERVDTPEHLRSVSTLENNQITELLSLAAHVNRAFPSEPQIIEWTYDQRRLILLQLRPISGMYPQISEVTSSGQSRIGTRAYLQFNALLGTNAPLSPLGTSMWRELLSRLMGAVTKQPSHAQPPWFKVVGGRIWLDITNQLLLAPNRRFLLNLVYERLPGTEQLLGRALQAHRDGLKSQGRTLGDFRLRILWRTSALGFYRPTKAAFRLKTRGADTLEAMEQSAIEIHDLSAALLWLEKCLDSITTMILDQLSYALPGLMAREWIQKQLHKWPPVAVNIHVLQQLLYNNPSLEITRVFYIASTYFIDNNQDINEHLKELHSLLRSLNHYGFVDLDPGSPRWEEEEYLLEGLIEAFKMTQEDPEQRMRELREKAENISMLLPKLADKHDGGFSRRQMEFAVKIAKLLAGAEQQIVECLVQAIAIIRRVFMQIGTDMVAKGYLEDSDDIFYLSLDDLRSGVGNWSSIAKEKRQEHESELNRNPVPLLLLNTGEAIYPEATDLPFDQLKGIALTPGEYTGFVRIITEESLPYIERGEVLVFREFDPKWSNSLIYAGALIFEEADRNSYHSVMGRIFAVPAAIGVTHASQILRTGMSVHLDGNRGLITILSTSRDAGESSPDFDAEGVAY